MAYRRSIAARSNLLYNQRFRPSFSYIHRDDDDHKSTTNNPISESPKIPNYIQKGLLGTRSNNFCRVNGSKRLFQDNRFAIPVSYGPVFARYMSATSVGGGKIETVSDVVEVLADKAAEAGPVVSEVATAAADSFFPVAALQYLIDYVHSITGFNWWASIITTTLMIRWLTVPLMINQLKATSKLNVLKPQLEEIREDMQNKGMSPTAVAQGQAQMQALFKQYATFMSPILIERDKLVENPPPGLTYLDYRAGVGYRCGVTPFTPLKGILIQGPIFVSFFLAISNMAEKVPSFKQGGIFWFTDLTTPDAMYIFPVLTALTFWITIECNAQEGLEGTPNGRIIKNVSRGFAALSIPFTMGFPKAVFCYWMTSNLFSLVYGLTIKNHKVKNLLGIPVIPIQPPSKNQKPAVPFFEMLKKFAAAQQQPLPLPAEASKPTMQNLPPPLVLNQRPKSLEKEVKGKKKGKKRLKR